MSPASRSRAKDRTSSKALAKEQHKFSLKSSSAATNGGANNLGSAYNPVSGTFHILESPGAVFCSQQNGRTKTVDDDVEEHISGSLLGRGSECESTSNIDACSVDSEDQKDKAPNSNHWPETIPGADNDKRERIRQKNGRKHQRQREKRSQELHERCSGYLMSRKLEALSQKLVGMGFSSERSTMALILNDGRMEESVAWLFEGGEEVGRVQSDDINLNGSNLKIEITDELAQITRLECQFKCTKQEIERVVVACEGDLDKAEKMLAEQKQTCKATPLESKENGDATVCKGSTHLSSLHQTSDSLVQARMISGVSHIHHRRDEREVNYSRSTGSPSVHSVPVGNRRRLQTKAGVDCMRPQQQSLELADRRWATVGTSSPTVLSSPSASLPTKVEAAQFQALPEVKIASVASSLKEPMMMQWPQSKTSLRPHPSSITDPPPLSRGWDPNGISEVGGMKIVEGVGHKQSVANDAVRPDCFRPHPRKDHYKAFPCSPTESGCCSCPNTSALGCLSSASMEIPSSLGLFTGQTSRVGSRLVDWSTSKFMSECDYTNIDWSVNANSQPTTKLKGWWSGLSISNDDKAYTSDETNMERSRTTGLCESSQVGDIGPSHSSGSQEWTSPFAGKDLFSISRKIVTFPSP